MPAFGQMGWSNAYIRSTTFPPLSTKTILITSGSSTARKRDSMASNRLLNFLLIIFVLSVLLEANAL
jgi:hypothetical protein